MRLTHKLTPKEAREILGLSRKEVVNLSGLSMATICRIESDETEWNIHYLVAELLAETLACSVDEIEWPRSLSHHGRPPLTGRSLERKLPRRVTTVTVVEMTRYSVVTEACCPNCKIVQAPINGACACCGQ